MNSNLIERLLTIHSLTSYSKSEGKILSLLQGNKFPGPVRVVVG